MPPTVWKPDHYVTAYELARSGLSDEKIAGAMGTTSVTLRKWKQTKPAFAEAINRGRKFLQKGNQMTFRDYVYNRLPPKLKLLWDQIKECDEIPNGVRRAEALLKDAGKRARQHLFLYALTSSSFNMRKALQSVNIPRRTLDTWITSDPDFAELMHDILEYKKDFYENALVGRVASGDTAAIIFANKTFNKDRGYSEKIDVQVNGSMVHSHNLIDIEELHLPLDIRLQILEAIRQCKGDQNGTDDE